jgi:hypothetical protein
MSDADLDLIARQHERMLAELRHLREDIRFLSTIVKCRDHAMDTALQKLEEPRSTIMIKAARFTITIGLGFAIILIAFISYSRAEPSANFLAPNGNYAGSSFNYGRSATFTDQHGQFTGSSITHGNSTSFTNSNGQFASSSITHGNSAKSLLASLPLPMHSTSGACRE